MNSENGGERLTFRASSRLVAQLDDIKDIKELDYSSDAVREAIEFYHEYLAGGRGMGTLILHLPHGMISRAEPLIGWIDNDLPGVLKQAMNVGISFMLEDVTQQEKNGERLQRARIKNANRTPDSRLTVTK